MVLKNKIIITISTIAFFVASVIASSCNKNNLDLGTVKGYKPIYLGGTRIGNLTPQAYKAPGKILQNGNFTFQVDNGYGIHIIDCTTPVNAHKVGFISVPGITDVHMKNNVLFANLSTDLVAIEINQIGEAKEINRIKNIFQPPYYKTPPHEHVYFECVDDSKGEIVEWQLTDIENPKCKTF
jgi:hypothetical protein